MSDTPRTDALHNKTMKIVADKPINCIALEGCERELWELSRQHEHDLSAYQQAEMPEEPDVKVFTLTIGGIPTKLDGQWVAKKDYDALRAHLARVTVERNEAIARLPEGMKHCAIVFKECKKGHGWLTATNWVQHECPTCELAAAKEAQARAEIDLKAAHLVRDANRIRAESAESKLAECERDAERYKWLRDNPWDEILTPIIQHQMNKSWDVAIDAAIAKESSNE